MKFKLPKPEDYKDTDHVAFKLSHATCNNMDALLIYLHACLLLQTL